MRFIKEEGRLVTSASDLKAAAECEFAWLRAIDAKLGRVAAVTEPEDATLARAGVLGTAHELRVLEAYRREHGDGVVEIDQTSSADAEGLAAAVARTNAALLSDAAVIYQAAFATDDFVGFADFLVRDEHGRWIVQDTKLARRARVTALMQLAAYVDQLDRIGVPRADRVELLLGNGQTSTHLVDDILPVFELRRRRLRELIVDRRLDLGETGSPVAWGDERYLACGRCATCEAEVSAARDLLLVAGMRPVQRERLRRAGVTTIDELAGALAPPSGMSVDTFGLLRTQARLQLSSEAQASNGDAEAGVGEPVPSPPLFEVVMPSALANLPVPDPGDLFFDFEGDPLYTETAGLRGEGSHWGIDYLFGWVDVDERFTALWAHSFDEERVAFEQFLDFVDARRAAHPSMHIYHYAPYEPTHLLAMAAHYGVREGDVDRLLRDGVFVDLYPIVRRALRVGSRSYSIKKLEPLYMGAEVRTSDVQRGDESIVQYVEARALIEAGDAVAGRQILEDIADYNRYDCVSTLRLRDWLAARARDAGVRPAPELEAESAAYEPSQRAVALDRFAAALAGADRSVGAPPGSDELALRLAAAAIDYYPREAKSFWATHFLRLREPVTVWEETRDVLAIDADRSRVIEDWHRGEGQRTDRRLLELRGDLAPGTKLTVGSTPFVLYDLPAPFDVDASPRWIHADHRATVIEVLDDGAIVEEFARAGMTWSDLPLAVTPAAPPRALSQQVAIDAWADALIAAQPGFPADAATDILRRVSPRTRSGRLARVGSADGTLDAVSSIVDSLVDLDHSYLAVQGPPGTGKTYVGSHVIERLVRERKWKVGVVAQSHAVIENMLDRIIDAGVPAELVGKAPKDPTSEVGFTVFPKNGMAAFTAQHSETGFVIGGTAWDFSNEGRVPRGSLDLLVIDEAGQFSLASTVAVSLAAQRLLLLGDPQQLPQVSQGTHPEPVDTSALGWVMDGTAVIAPENGYFLAQSWRMHPSVAAPVSRLSYDGQLASHPSASERTVVGWEPGLHLVPIEHRGNATHSPEEAAEVVRLVRGLVGAPWIDPSEHVASGADASDPRDGATSRPLRPDDIIVVTPYNAQQNAVHEALESAGFGDVPVGTVDKFQGQEAAVAIVSLAASGARDAPRGADFLLLANRLNVAISRAKAVAFLVYSPGLLDDLPHTPEGVARLSAFARLVGAGTEAPSEPGVTAGLPVGVPG